MSKGNGQWLPSFNRITWTCDCGILHIGGTWCQECGAELVFEPEEDNEEKE